MYRQEAREEYLQAQRLGQREYKLAVAAGEEPYPAVLDEVLQGRSTDTVKDMGLVEIPAEKIVGVKSAGRITAFTASFRPLLDIESEFGNKWVDLCLAHLTEGIQEPILCYEYLGQFYVQEGNKRVSVLRHMGSPRIPGVVKRVVPPMSDDPRVKAYYEFVEFHKDTGLYLVQFRRPGDYAALLSYLGKEPGESWDERERRTFASYFGYFREAFAALDSKKLGLLPEEALLIWLRVHPFKDLARLSSKELRRTVTALWDDMLASAQPEPVEVRTAVPETESRPNVISRIISGTPDHLNVAFVHPMGPEVSPWVRGHDLGRQHLEQVMGDKICVRSYYGASNPDMAEQVLEQAVAEGAEVVFTTTPQLSRSTLRAAVKNPKVRFLNCSVDTPYSSIRTYYSRIYEAKFITGAIAGAMANNDRIGYIGTAPIYGVPASINAFALGAQLTNPRAKVILRWSCQAGSAQRSLLQAGVQVISNRDVPTQEEKYADFHNYGTYAWDDVGNPEPIGSPVWLWGKFYENVVKSIFAGTWDKDKDSPRAVNYWWGMDSGVIDVALSDSLPDGLRALAEILRQGLKDGTVDPFRRRIVDQEGNVKNDGSRSLTPDELLRMDWLCDNVVGSIPEFEELEPFAQPMVRELGVYRDRIPMEKEGTL